jgi:hypothetical protein
MWAQVSNEELCWHMNMANMNARIMRNMIKFILDNDPDGKFNHFLDINKGQFEMCGGIVPPGNTSQTFSVYQMIVYQIRQTRKMIKQDGEYAFKKSNSKEDKIVFPSNATQRQHMSIAKNFLDNSDPGWDDTDDEDVDDFNGLIPDSAKKLKTDKSDAEASDTANSEADQADQAEAKNADDDDNDDNDDDEDYEVGEEDDDDDEEEDGEECD